MGAGAGVGRIGLAGSEGDSTALSKTSGIPVDGNDSAVGGGVGATGGYGSAAGAADWGPVGALLEGLTVSG